MGMFNKPATQYVTVAASQTTAPVGVVGCYLESVTVIPATTASGAVTILDGSTAIATGPYCPPSQGQYVISYDVVLSHNALISLDLIRLTIIMG
jgi:hypothetical protein